MKDTKLVDDYPSFYTSLLSSSNYFALHRQIKIFVSYECMFSCMLNVKAVSTVHLVRARLVYRPQLFDFHNLKI